MGALAGGVVTGEPLTDRPLYEIPKRTLRWRIHWRWWLLRHRAKTGWLRAFAPHKLHPETLSSTDGEPPFFIRADLAATRADVPAALAKDYGATVEDVSAGLDPVEEIREVWMVEHVFGPCVCANPDEDIDDDCPAHDEEGWYDVVPAGTKGATRYWKWNW